MAANAIIGYGNRTDASTLSGGSSVPTLPLTNLQDRNIGIVWRTTDAALASTQFDVDISVDKLIRVISLVGNNLSLSSLYRIRGATDAAFTDVQSNSGWLDVWPTVYNTLQLEWESLQWWDGRYLAEDIEGYTWSLIHILGATTSLRYWRLEIDDTTNSSGYVQAGRLFMGPAWQPDINITLGFGLGWETDTEVQKALSGAEYFNRLTPFRVVRFSTEMMDTDEAMGNAFDIQRRVGVDGEVVFVLDPDDTLHVHRRQFFGRL